MEYVSQVITKQIDLITGLRAKSNNFSLYLFKMIMARGVARTTCSKRCDLWELGDGNKTRIDLGGNLWIGIGRGTPYLKLKMNCRLLTMVRLLRMEL